MPRHLLILVMALSVGTATAQPAPSEKGKKWEFSVFYGVSSRGDHLFATPFVVATGGNTSTIELRNVGLNFAPGYMVGARITENLGDHFGAELEYNLANQPMQFTNLTPTTARVDLQQRVHSVNYAILLYGLDRKHKLRPYGVLGPSLSYFETYGDSVARAVAAGVPVKDRWQVGGVVGGGVKYHATKEIGFRFDVRDNFTGVPSYGLPDTGAAQKAALLPDGMLHNWQFSVGFFYTFKGR